MRNSKLITLGLVVGAIALVPPLSSAVQQQIAKSKWRGLPELLQINNHHYGYTIEVENPLGNSGDFVVWVRDLGPVLDGLVDDRTIASAVVLHQGTPILTLQEVAPQRLCGTLLDGQLHACPDDLSVTVWDAQGRPLGTTSLGGLYF